VNYRRWLRGWRVLRSHGSGRLASGAVLAVAAVLAACAVGFGIWATLTKNSAAFGLAGVYSLVLAAVVAGMAMIGWVVGRGQPHPPISPSSRAAHTEVQGGHGEVQVGDNMKAIGDIKTCSGSSSLPHAEPFGAAPALSATAELSCAQLRDPRTGALGRRA
jgi:hypothetical protein